MYLSRSLMRQHIGRHIVKQKVNKHLNLCSFCGTVCENKQIKIQDAAMFIFIPHYQYQNRLLGLHAPIV